ncbi:MAG: hypothetical protein QXJ25_02165 [Candidatus Aenigmatarchaeota archaeon]
MRNINNKIVKLRKKGQMFLITAVILMVTLVILAASIKVSQPALDRAYIESSLESKIFKNIKEEIAKIPIYSFYDELNENVLDFLTFVRNYVKPKGFRINVIYLASYHNNTNFVNISFINFWNEALNVTLKINTTPEQTKNFIIEDSTVYDTKFDITPGENYTLEILFNGYEEKIIIQTNTMKSSYTYFFDIRMFSSLGTRIEKYVNTISST